MNEIKYSQIKDNIGKKLRFLQTTTGVERIVTFYKIKDDIMLGRCVAGKNTIYLEFRVNGEQRDDEKIFIV